MYFLKDSHCVVADTIYTTVQKFEVSKYFFMISKSCETEDWNNYTENCKQLCITLINYILKYIIIENCYKLFIKVCTSLYINRLCPFLFSFHLFGPPLSIATWLNKLFCSICLHIKIKAVETMIMYTNASR